MKRKTKLTVFIPDVHVPFEDKEALGAVYEFIEEYEPEQIILTGDFFDFYEVSRFSKDPKRAHNFQDEMDIGVEYLTQLREIAPDADIKYKEGNHEDRINKYLQENPELGSLRSLKPENLMGLEKLDIKYYPAGTRLKVGKYDIIHGHQNDGAKLAKHSAYTAKGNVEKYNSSIIQGHPHRMGSYYRRTLDGILEGHEIGNLCQDMPYTNNPDWQSSFAMIWEGEDVTTFEGIRIDNGKFIYGGKTYGKKRSHLDTVRTRIKKGESI